MSRFPRFNQRLLLFLCCKGSVCPCHREGVHAVSLCPSSRLKNSYLCVRAAGQRVHAVLQSGVPAGGQRTLDAMEEH